MKLENSKSLEMLKKLTRRGRKDPLAIEAEEATPKIKNRIFETMMIKTPQAHNGTTAKATP